MRSLLMLKVGCATSNFMSLNIVIPLLILSSCPRPSFAFTSKQQCFQTVFIKLFLLLCDGFHEGVRLHSLKIHQCHGSRQGCGGWLCDGGGLTWGTKQDPLLSRIGCCVAPVTDRQDVWLAAAARLGTVAVAWEVCSDCHHSCSRTDE